ncbi:MAG TPA: hypothetical protein VHK24_13995 [Steroidobacter sp.]|nr:hypothetical protein [Steroidobacter sp.]
MSIDWGKFQDDVDAAVKNAGANTDAKLASKISGISRLTEDEIRQLFPESADAKKLAELMEIVRSAGQQHEKINRIVGNAESFGKVIFTLLAKFA